MVFTAIHIIFIAIPQGLYTNYSPSHFTFDLHYSIFASSEAETD
jgi:hypothetical protein